MLSYFSAPTLTITELFEYRKSLSLIKYDDGYKYSHAESEAELIEKLKDSWCLSMSEQEMDIIFRKMA